MREDLKHPPLSLGTKTAFGKVVGIRTEGGPLGERYYFLKDKDGDISFMPYFSVEPWHTNTNQGEGA